MTDEERSAEELAKVRALLARLLRRARAFLKEDKL